MTHRYDIDLNQQHTEWSKKIVALNFSFISILDIQAKTDSSQVISYGYSELVSL